MPLSQAKWPFFISLSTQQLSNTLGGFAAPIDSWVYHWLTQFTPYRRGSKQLNLLYAGQHDFNSREGADPRVAPNATRRGNDNFHQFQARWSNSPSASSTLELGFGVAHAILSSGFQPGTLTTSTVDLPLLTVTGSAPFSFSGTHTRYQANAQLQVVHDGRFGSNSVVLGTAFDRSNIMNRWNTLGGIEQILVEGSGAEVVRWNTPTQARQHVSDFAAFVQDAWRPATWLAAPLGLRFESASGRTTVVNDRVVWTTIEPRLGFVLRLPVRGSVLRGGFARYGHLFQGRYLDFGNAATLGGQVLQWLDTNGDRQVQQPEIGRLLRVFGGPYSAVDTNLRRPFTDEITVEVTQRFGDRFVTRFRFFRRDDRHLVAVVNAGVPFSNYVPTLVTDPATTESWALQTINLWCYLTETFRPSAKIFLSLQTHLAIAAVIRASRSKCSSSSLAIGKLRVTLRRCMFRIRPTRAIASFKTIRVSLLPTSRFLALRMPIRIRSYLPLAGPISIAASRES